MLDCAIVGGGLQGVLVALALRARSPQARLAVIESGPSLGGNHLWSFHGGDLPAAAAALVDPLVVRRWPAWRVRFPDHARVVAGGYASISSQRLDEVARAALGDAVITGETALRVAAGEVALSGGRRLRARLVVDARGPGQLDLGSGEHAYQKFAGVELRVQQAPELPTLMDATVPQLDGCRFIYVLPLAPDRVLVEDTRYSLSPALDVERVERDALAWAGAHGLQGEVVRREHGVLPLPLDPPAPPPADGVVRAGYGGGLFHPTTGYSLPLAVRLALHLAESGPDLGELLAPVRAQQRFCALLNRLLFRAVPEGERWRVFSRFHRLPAATIARFYALRLTRADRARILCGRPPAGVSLRRAFAELRP